MSTPTAYTSKRLPYNLTTVNIITAVVMVLFHIGAVAALFYFIFFSNLLEIVPGIETGPHRIISRTEDVCVS